MGRKFNLCLLCYPHRITKNTGKGIDRYSYEIFTHLDKKQMQVMTIENNKGENYEFDQFLYELFAYKKTVSTIADLYHAMSPRSAKIAFLARKKPVITTIHDMLPLIRKEWHSCLAKHYYRLCTYIARKSDAIIVSSNYYRSFVISMLKVPEEKVKVVRMGVDHSSYYPLNLPKDSDVKRILFIGGTWHRHRGIVKLLQAFSVLCKRINNLELLIGGAAQDIDQTKNLAINLGINKKVRFLGFIPEEKCPEVYNSVDVYVFPSKAGFSLSLLEAMACGTPVVAGNAFDAPEYVADAGILINPYNVNELIQSLLAILTNDELRRDLSIRGLKKARNFSWEKMMEETMSVYEEL